jgi:hypothetical protein
MAFWSYLEFDKYLKTFESFYIIDKCIGWGLVGPWISPRKSTVSIFVQRWCTCRRAGNFKYYASAPPIVYREYFSNIELLKIN